MTLDFLAWHSNLSSARWSSRLTAWLYNPWIYLFFSDDIARRNREIGTDTKEFA